MMTEPVLPLDAQQHADRRHADRRHADPRRGVRRTVLLFVAIAVLIYVGFILSGVLAGRSA